MSNEFASDLPLGPVRREMMRGPVRNWYNNGRLIRPGGTRTGQKSETSDYDDTNDIKCKWCFDIATHTWRYMHYPHPKYSRKDCPCCSRGIIGKSMGASLRKDQYNMVRDELCDTVLKVPLVTVNVADNKLVDPCPICLEPIRKNNTRALRCGHTFCKKCINCWFKTSSAWSANAYACPLCRKK